MGIAQLTRLARVCGRSKAAKRNIFALFLLHDAGGRCGWLGGGSGRSRPQTRCCPYSSLQGLARARLFLRARSPESFVEELGDKPFAR
eukprot:6181831-Pleurochrysis_carterae.AAC.1